MLGPSSVIGIAALAAAVVEAQTPRPSTTLAAVPSATSSGAAVTHTIAVGAVGFNFEPNNITAAVGDTIEFNFYPGGHSVARSDFGSPCVPWEVAGVNRGPGFWSETKDTNVYSPNGPKYRVRINDTAPIFYYCNAPTSCWKHHMIGAINPNATWTFEKQLEYVNSATFQVTPGERLPSEGAGTYTPSATNPAPTPTASPPPAETATSSSSNHLGAGPIAGIAIGAAAVAVLAGALIYLCGRYSRKSSPAMPVHENRNSFPTHHMAAGPMTDAKFGSSPSPHQDPFRTTSTSYSAAPSSDPYRQGGHSPPLHQHFSTTSSGLGSPPLGSPGLPSAYGNGGGNGYQTLGPQVLSPMNIDGSQQQQQQQAIGQAGAPSYYPPGHTPPPPHQQQPPQQPPAELPTSADPGNSPIPPYSAQQRHMSWGAGAESAYRPSGKGQ